MKFVVVVCESSRLNQSLSHRQSIIPVTTIPRGVRSPQVVLFAPLPSQSDIHMVSGCRTLHLLNFITSIKAHLHLVFTPRALCS